MTTQLPPEVILRISLDLPQEEALRLARIIPDGSVILGNYPLKFGSGLCDQISYREAKAMLFNPKVDDRELFLCAAPRGWVDIVNILLKEKKIDSKTREDGIVHVAQQGHPKVIQAILEDSQLSFDPQMILIEGIEFNQPRVVEFFLQKKVLGS